MDKIGYRVLNRRKDMGLSQEALARRANISRSYLSAIERGIVLNVSLYLLSRLAIALETTPTWLIDQSNQGDVPIPRALYELGMKIGLSFTTVDKLARIPQRGREPQSMKEWQQLYEAIYPYL